MFEREHHIRIAAILEALDAKVLAANRCFFGGGTAIVLSHHEYRESLDIDFLVSDRNGYSTLRQTLTSPKGLKSITHSGITLNQVGDLRADQYGVRAMLRVATTEIKIEIVFESRIELSSPKKRDHICGIATLTQLDMAATKLLANSDRWADDGVFSRDLIDLAMLEAPKPLLRQALEKATHAYGDSIQRDLHRSIKRLGERVGRLDECMSALKMNNTPKALLWKHIRRLGTV